MNRFAYAILAANQRLPFKSNLGILLASPSHFVSRYRWSFLFMLTGTFLDTITTMRSMWNYGNDGEVHLVMYYLTEWLGVGLGVPVGSVLRVLFVIFAACLFRSMTRWVLLLCGTLYCLAAVSNHFVLL